MIDLTERNKTEKLLRERFLKHIIFYQLNINIFYLIWGYQKSKLHIRNQIWKFKANYEAGFQQKQKKIYTYFLSWKYLVNQSNREVS